MITEFYTYGSSLNEDRVTINLNAIYQKPLTFITFSPITNTWIRGVFNHTILQHIALANQLYH